MGRRGLAVALALSVAGVVGSGLKGYGDVYTWVGGNGNWSDSGNWLGGNVPGSTATDVVVLPSGNFTATADGLHNPWVLNSLQFNGPTSSVIAATNVAGIQFGGVSPAIVVNSSDPNTFVNPTINSPLNFAQTTAISYGYVPGPFSETSYVLTLGGCLSGAGGLVINSGFVDLTQANTFTGGLTLNGSSFFPIGTEGGVPAFYGSAAYIETNQSLGTDPLVLNANGQSTTVEFFANSTTTYNNDMVVMGSTNRLLSATRSVGTTVSANAVLFFKHLTFASGESSLDVGESFSETAGPPSVSFTEVTLAGNGTFFGHNFPIFQVKVGSIDETGGSHSLSVGSTLSLLINGASSYSGGTYLTGVAGVSNLTMVSANASGALGSGPVQLTNGTLTLNAAGAAANTVTATTAGDVINYNANGGAGGHLVTAGVLNIGGAVTNFGGDAFAMLAGGSLSGNATQEALLTRGSNFSAGAGVTITNTSGGLPAVQNLGTNGDIVIALAAAYTGDLALGVGTPWMGITSVSGETFTGNLMVHSAVSLSNLTLSGTNITDGPSDSPSVVTVNNLTTSSSQPDYSGVSKFVLKGLWNMSGSDALGGGGGTAPASVEVQSGGELEVGNTLGLNGNILLHGNTTLWIKGAGLSGAGVITRDNQPLTLILGNANAVAGSQLGTGFVQAGDTVFLETANIVGVKNIDAGTHYVIDAGPQASGFTLNGGSLYFSQSLPFGFSAGPTGSGDSVIRVGPTGAAFATKSFGLDMAVNVPVLAQGPLSIGLPDTSASTVASFLGNIGPSNSFFTGGGIVLTNSANSYTSIDLYKAKFASTVPSTLNGVTVNLHGGEFAIFSSSTASPVVPLFYNTTVNVLGNAQLDDNLSNFHASGAPLPGSTHPVAIPTLNIGNSTLSLDISWGLTVNALNLSGDATLSGNRSFGFLPITIGQVTEDGIAPRALSITSGSNDVSRYSYLFTGAFSNTGQIGIMNNGVEIDGVVAASSAPVLIQSLGRLAGVGTIHRTVTFSASGEREELSPGTVSNPTISSVHSNIGTLTVDSVVFNAVSKLDVDLTTPGVVGGSANDLLVVNGDLTLDGTLAFTSLNFGIGTYRIINYGGTLTDDGMSILTPGQGFNGTIDLSTPGQVNLVVTAVPEVGTMVVVSCGVMGLFMRRRRRSA